jgi:CheY-like chemotaxis protein
MGILEGKRILLLEDEVIIAMEAEAALGELGAETVSAYQLKEALELATTGTFDAAVLDSNINGQRSSGVEDALRARDIPFIRATGYGGDEKDEVPVVDKPYDGRKLEAALRRVLASGS